MGEVSDKEGARPRRILDSDEAPELRRLLEGLGPISSPPGMRERVWRKLEGPQPRPWGRWVPALVAASAAVAVLWFWPIARAPSISLEPFATVWMTAGEVKASAGAERWRVVRAGEVLSDAVQLETGQQGRALVHWENAGALLKEGSRASLGAGELRLAQGGVCISAQKRSSKRALVVVAPGYAVRVVGTVFSVDAAPGRLEVRVNEGAVEVSGPTGKLVLRAGESWSSEEGKAAKAMEEADALAAGLARAAVGGHSVLRIEGPPGLEVAVDGVVLGRAPASLWASLGARQVVAGPAGRSHRGEAHVLEGQETVYRIVEEPPRPVPPPERTARPNVAHRDTRPALPLGPVSEPADPIEALRQKLGAAPGPEEKEQLSYELAGLLKQRGLIPEALEAYQGLAQGKGLRAELSQYELGRIRLKVLSDAKGASREFERYQLRFPKGSLAAEVEVSLMEAQLALGRLAEAEKSMTGFIDHRTDSERWLEVRLLRGGVRRERGDCRKALEDYTLVADRGAFGAEEALFQAAYCHERLGEVDLARRSLVRYLEQFPSGRHALEARRALGNGP